MKKVFSRVLTIMLVLALVVSVSGCGSTQKNSSSSSDGSSKSLTGSLADTSETSSIDTSKKVNIRMITFANTPRDLELVNDEVNKITEKAINATVSLEAIGMTDWRTKYNLMLTSGEPIDIIWTATWNNFQSNALKGAYLQLDELLPKAAPELLTAIPEEYWEMAKVKGKSYCIPSMNEGYTSWGFMYREDLRKKYNLPEVKDMATVEAYLEGIKENDPTIQPVIDIPEVGTFQAFYSLQHIWPRFGAVQYSYGIAVNMENPRELIKFTETPEFAEYAKTTKEWVDKGLLRSDILSNKENAWQALRSGKYASTIASSDPSRLNSNVLVPASAEHPEWEFGYLNWGILSKMTVRSHPTFFASAIPKSSQNPERALMFMEKVFTDKDLNRLLDDGIEGKHYKIDDQGYYVSLDDQKNPGYAQASFGTNPLFVEEFKIYPKTYDFVKEVFKELDEYDVPNYYEGFAEDYSTYNGERAALGQVWTQYGLPLIAGIVPDVDAGIKTLNDQMKAAGSDKVYDEFSKQWLEYMDSMGVK